MGTHSKGIIANTFLGSTAKRVLRRTRKPVFIIPLPKEETDIAFGIFEGFKSKVMMGGHYEYFSRL